MCCLQLTVLKFLGLKIHSVKMTLTFPKAKIKKLVSKQKGLISSPRTAFLKVISMISTPLSTAQVVLLGFLLIRYL